MSITVSLSQFGLLSGSVIAHSCTSSSAVAQTAPAARYAFVDATSGAFQRADVDAWRQPSYAATVNGARTGFSSCSWQPRIFFIDARAMIERREIIPFRPSRIDSIRGKYCGTAEHYGIKRIIVAAKCRAPLFVVDREDRTSPFARRTTQHGTLVVNPCDLEGMNDLPAKFFVHSFPKIEFPDGIVFPRAVEIADDSGTKAISIGADVVIGRRVTFELCREIGAGSVIGEGCSFYASSLGRRVWIAPQSKISDARIGNDVSIGGDARFYKDASLSGVSIGDGTSIGERFRIGGSGSFTIGRDVTVGNDVRILKVDRSDFIGDGATIEDCVYVKKSVSGGATIRTSAAPNPEGIVIRDDVKADELSAEAREIAGLFNGQTALSRAAAQTVEREPLLFLASRLLGKAWQQYSLVRDGNAALVCYGDDSINNTYYARYRYFSGEEIPPAFLARERTVSADERRALMRMPAILSSIRQAREQASRHPGLRVRAHLFEDSSAEEIYLLLSHLKDSRAAFSQGRPRLLDIGSGLGAAAKVADLFFQTDGIEKDGPLHRLALEHRPDGSGANLVHGDFFDLDLAPYDVAYFFQQISTEQTSSDPRHFEFQTPYAERLRRKMAEFRPGTLIVLGPQYLYSDFGGVKYPATARLGAAFFSNLQLLNIELPRDVAHYAVFVRP